MLQNYETEDLHAESTLLVAGFIGSHRRVAVKVGPLSVPAVAATNGNVARPTRLFRRLQTKTGGSGGGLGPPVVEGRKWLPAGI